MRSIGLDATKSRGLMAFVLLMAGAPSGSAMGQALDRTRQEPPTLQLLEAAAEHAVATVEGAVIVDPRPIAVRHALPFPSVEDYPTVPEAEVLARTQAVATVGLDVTDAFPLRAACTPPLVPPPYRDHSGCPDEGVTVLVFGRAVRSGGGCWRLPVISIYYSPRGRSVHTADLYLVPDEASWRVSRRVVRVVFD